MYYDKQGKKITMEEWTKLFMTSYKIIKQDTLSNGRKVSTIWLGLDHGWDETRKPVIFETMVFAADNDEGTDEADGDMKRYSTIEDAEKGHKKMVKKYTDK